MEKITIGKLAQMSGVGVETVRFYQRKELLREPEANGSVRTYSHEDALKIKFIKRAQEIGFSLAEVKELLQLNTKPRVTCGTVKKKALEKIDEIDEKIASLQKMRTSLVKLSKACNSSQDSFKQYKVEECFQIGDNYDC